MTILELIWQLVFLLIKKGDLETKLLYNDSLFDYELCSSKDDYEKLMKDKKTNPFIYKKEIIVIDLYQID